MTNEGVNEITKIKYENRNDKIIKTKGRNSNWTILLFNITSSEHAPTLPATKPVKVAEPFKNQSEYQPREHNSQR